MAEPQKMIAVGEWPMGSYPWLVTESKKYPDPEMRDKRVYAGDIYTNFFKVEVRRPDGTLDFKTYQPVDAITKKKATDEEGNPIFLPSEQKVTSVTTALLDPVPRLDESDREWRGVRSKIHSVDLRRVEREIEGRPSSVLAALWFKWDGQTWEPVDRDKVRHPLFWYDVSERYETWRKDAYENMVDPYKEQKRPYTRIQEMEKKMRELEAQLAEKQGAPVGGN